MTPKSNRGSVQSARFRNNFKLYLLTNNGASRCQTSFDVPRRRLLRDIFIVPHRMTWKFAVRGCLCWIGGSFIFENRTGRHIRGNGLNTRAASFFRSFCENEGEGSLTDASLFYHHLFVVVFAVLFVCRLFRSHFPMGGHGRDWGKL